MKVEVNSEATYLAVGEGPDILKWRRLRRQPNIQTFNHQDIEEPSHLDAWMVEFGVDNGSPGEICR